MIINGNKSHSLSKQHHSALPQLLAQLELAGGPSGLLTFSFFVLLHFCIVVRFFFEFLFCFYFFYLRIFVLLVFPPLPPPSLVVKDY